MHKKSEWVWIDPSDYDELHEIGIGGKPTPGDPVELVSPYDIPQRVRARKDEDGRIVIEFGYFGHEATVARSSTNDVGVTLGKNSNRVYRLTVLPSGTPMTRLKGAKEKTTLINIIRGALGDVESSAGRKSPNINYQVATRVIRDHASELLLQEG